MSGTQTITLAFDTATEEVVVGLLRGERVLAEAAIAAAPGDRPPHSAALLVEVERAVGLAGGWDRVDRIGVGVGPGSFTGLRIAIATAKALALATGMPLVSVGTLSALALGIAEREGAPGRLCLPLIDARRGEVFAQLHDGDGEALSEPAVLAPERIGEWLGSIAGKPLANGAERPLAAGSGALRFRRELEIAGVEALPENHTAHRLSASELCRLAELGRPLPPERVEPLYLRKPDAKRWLERDRD